MLTHEALAGLVVGLALIPEAIAFSVIAGIDPKVGLFSSFIMAVSIAFLGGRPAVVTAATVVGVGVRSVERIDLRATPRSGRAASLDAPVRASLSPAASVAHPMPQRSRRGAVQGV